MEGGRSDGSSSAEEERVAQLSEPGNTGTKFRGAARCGDRDPPWFWRTEALFLDILVKKNTGGAKRGLSRQGSRVMEQQHDEIHFSQISS